MFKLTPRLFVLAPLVLVACSVARDSGDGQAADPVASESAPPANHTQVDLGLDTEGVSFRGLSVPDADAIWISGSAGTIVRSSDGGTTWNAVGTRATESTWTSSATNDELAELDFRMIVAFDSSEAWAASAGSGGASRLFHTTNAGGKWAEVLVNKDPEGFWDALAFWDRNAGMIVGDPTWSESAGRKTLTVLVTEDAGATWQRRGADTIPDYDAPELSAAQPELNEYCFAASNSSIALAGKGKAWVGTGGAVARVLRTEDRGRTWEAADTGMGQSNAAAGVFALTVIENGDGPPTLLAVGGKYDEPDSSNQTAAFSHDGGKTWQLPSSPIAGFRSAVVYEESLGYAAGTTGLSSWLGPNFESWSTQPSPANALSLLEVTEEKRTILWAAGPGDAVWTTQLTWTSF